VEAQSPNRPFYDLLFAQEKKPISICSRAKAMRLWDARAEASLNRFRWKMNVPYPDPRGGSRPSGAGRERSYLQTLNLELTPPSP